MLSYKSIRGDNLIRLTFTKCSCNTRVLQKNMIPIMMCSFIVNNTTRVLLLRFPPCLVNCDLIPYQTTSFYDMSIRVRIRPVLFSISPKIVVIFSVTFTVSLSLSFFEILEVTPTIVLLHFCRVPSSS
jgi:hypothetical protein